MLNYLLPERATIIKVIRENDLINRIQFRIDSKLQKKFNFLAGQFLLLGVPGFGEAPFTFSNEPRTSRDYLEVCVRAVGELTRKLNSLKKGDYLYWRGPFGNGFPEVKQNLILIGGGCGFIPLRSVLLENLKRSDIKVQTFFGCRDQSTLIFKNEFSAWRLKTDLRIILEKDVLPNFSDREGFVTDLIKRTNLIPDPVVFICGPEMMVKFVVPELLAKNIKEENIFISLERRMYCGTGVCQHCACGPKYVCKDGPVFSYAYLKTLADFVNL